ncbi:MAG: L-rhamnose isomerase [Brevinema sp.]
MSSIQQNYKIAKNTYAEYNIDTDAVLKQLKDIPVSIHCWQLDDLSGFENPDGELSGGIAAFGNAPGKPKNRKEYMTHLDKALSLIPGAKKLALHAIYSDEPTTPRNKIEPKHFESWISYAKDKRIGLDFNPTYFKHINANDGFTLSHPNQEIREFWIEHGIQCRKIGEYFGKELQQTAITNHWIPDGYKDITVDKLTPRLRLKESLNKIFAIAIDSEYNIDSVESKLFGLGSESYVVGSHEFYTNYVMENKNSIVCMDVGHYHPTETISSKIAAYLAFNQKLMLHVSRPVRWDSDHVVLLDEETKSIMEEIARYNAFDRVFIGMDFFDASINRISATAIGGRNTKKAILLALLQPTKELIKIEQEGNLTKRLALMEELKSLPFGLVWDMFCEQENVPAKEWIKNL